jgi:hypothetical protein
MRSGRMKKFMTINLVILTITGFLCSEKAEAQNCPIDPWILSNYYQNAQFYAYEEIINDTTHPFLDSVIIPQSIIDKYLGILSAVYLLQNSSSDSVFNVFQIGASFSIVPNNIKVGLDNSLQWVQELRWGNFPTGVADFDSLVIHYNLSFEHEFTYQGTAWFTLYADTFYNTIALAKLFASITGVEFSEIEGHSVILCYTTGSSANSNNITFNYYSDPCNSNQFFKIWHFNPLYLTLTPTPPTTF